MLRRGRKPKPKPQVRTVDLGAGGEIQIVHVGELMGCGPKERALVAAITDLMDAYEKASERERG